MFKRLKFNDKKVIGDIETNKAAIANFEGGGGGGLTTGQVNVIVDGKMEALVNPVSATLTISPTDAKEVGETLTNLTFNWGMGDNFASADSARIIDRNDNNAWLESIATPAKNGSVTKDVDVTRNTPGAQEYRFDVQDKLGRVISSAIQGLYWRYPYYYGNGEATIDEAGVKALDTKMLRASPTGNYTIPDAVAYKWIVIAAALTQPTKFTDDATGFAITMQPAVDITITNDHSVSIPMKAYRSVNAFGDDLIIIAE